MRLLAMGPALESREEEDSILYVEGDAAYIKILYAVLNNYK